MKVLEVVSYVCNRKKGAIERLNNEGKPSSLADFAKIVEVLDAAGASFVSVTQAFSTTTSMGRLTLNVLLSFAQFEREVITERIRDKVAASKAKGMWMVGPVPLGYAVRERMLVVVPDEAATVRRIMESYLAAQSLRTLVEQLRREGVVSKQRTMRDGTVRGGVPFRRGALAWLLSNRIYIGQTVHKGNVYPGQHDAIVSRELFDAVQAQLAERTAPGATQTTRRRVALLAGMIRDDRSRPMSPCHTRNHGRKYAYYASNMNDDASAPALRLPAGELEASVRSAIACWLRDAGKVRHLAPGCSAGDLARLVDQASTLADVITGAPVATAAAALEDLQMAVAVSASSIAVTISPSGLLVAAGIAGASAPIEIEVPCYVASLGHEPRLRLEPTSHQSTIGDARLIELVARAFSARDQLMAMDQPQLEATPVTRLRHLQRTARLAWLDPVIIRAILDGRQPASLSARSLWRMADLPLDWAAQRAALGFPAN